jgi:hypothetical protein
MPEMWGQNKLNSLERLSFNSHRMCLGNEGDSVRGLFKGRKDGILLVPKSGFLRNLGGIPRERRGKGEGGF